MYIQYYSNYTVRDIADVFKKRSSRPSTQPSVHVSPAVNVICIYNYVWKFKRQKKRERENLTPFKTCGMLIRFNFGGKSRPFMLFSFFDLCGVVWNGRRSSNIESRSPALNIPHFGPNEPQRQTETPRKTALSGCTIAARGGQKIVSFLSFSRSRNEIRKEFLFGSSKRPEIRWVKCNKQSRAFYHARKKIVVVVVRFTTEATRLQKKVRES